MPINANSSNPYNPNDHQNKDKSIGEDYMNKQILTK